MIGFTLSSGRRGFVRATLTAAAAAALALLPGFVVGHLYAAPPAGASAAADDKPSTSAQASTPAAPTIPYEKYKLPNGLEVILSQDSTLPLVTVNLWYHVGPANEVPGRTGFAHLFEHMMFEGSQHVGAKAHFKYLETAGATDINGSTGWDRTNYYETLPSNQLDLALWLESDRQGYLLGTLDIEKLANQRDVVRNERRQTHEGQPYGLVFEEAVHQLFPDGHPYHGEIIGSHADIEAARLNDVRNFYRQYYTPNNATLVIAGDFDKAQTKTWIEHYFGTIPSGPPVPKINVVTPPITSQRRAVVTDKVELPQIIYGWLTPAVFKPGYPECNLLASILGSGRSSRLYKKLVYEKQLAQSVDSGVERTGLGSIFYLVVTARPGVKPEDLEKAANEEIALMREKGPDAAELDRARNVLETQKILNLQRTGGVAEQLNYYNQYAGDPGYLGKDLASYDSLTPADLQRVAAAQLKLENSIMVYGIPGEKVIHDVPKTSPEEDKKEAQSAGNNTTMPDEAWRAKAPAAGPTQPFNAPVAEKFQLPNGLNVFLLERHTLPVVAVRFTSISGAETNPVDKPGLGDFTTSMLTYGTATRSTLEFAAAAERLGTSIDSLAGYNSANVSFTSLTKNAPGALDLVADAVRHPAFDSKEVDRIRKERITSVAQEDEQPVGVAIRTVGKELYPNSPYGFTVLGTADSNASITRDDMLAFWKRGFVPSNSALIVAGDVTPAQIRELATKYFGDWSGAPYTAQPPATPAPPKPAVYIVDRPAAPQTALILASLGAARTTADYVPLTVFNYSFGGLFSARLNMNLREKHGFTYGAFSQYDLRRGVGPFYAGAEVRTDATAEATSESFAELKRIREGELTADELNTAKTTFTKSLIANFETNNDMTDTLAGMYIYALPLDYYKKLPAQIDAVSGADVLRAAQKYTDPAATIVVAVGDKAKIEPGLTKLNLGPVSTVK